jgi:hypothetical protein
MKTRESECATVELLVKGPGKVVPAAASANCSFAKRTTGLLRLLHGSTFRSLQLFLS